MWFFLFISFFLQHIILFNIPKYLKPSFTELILFYLILKYPDKINIVEILLLGFVNDIIYESIIGIHAFSLSITAYPIFLKFKSCFYHYNIYQSLLISSILLFKEIIIYFMEIINNHKYLLIELFYNCLINGIIWPIILLIMKKINF